ncbi:MAG: hypothetical protein ACYSWU_29820 [Planctomycetota bacterium]
MAGIVLLVLILLGVPAMGVAGVLLLTLHGDSPMSSGPAFPPAPSVQFQPAVPAETEPLVADTAEAEPPDGSEPVEDGDQPAPTEQIPAVDQPEPGPPDAPPDAPGAEPETDSQTGRLFPHSTHRRLNT